jgi:hypothetical protein
MNAQSGMSENRELTADELDLVSGGNAVGSMVSLVVAASQVIAGSAGIVATHIAAGAASGTVST